MKIGDERRRKVKGRKRDVMKRKKMKYEDKMEVKDVNKPKRRRFKGIK